MVVFHERRANGEWKQICVRPCKHTDTPKPESCYRGPREYRQQLARARQLEKKRRSKKQTKLLLLLHVPAQTSRLPHIYPNRCQRWEFKREHFWFVWACLGHSYWIVCGHQHRHHLLLTNWALTKLQWPHWYPWELWIGIFFIIIMDTFGNNETRSEKYES